MVAFNFDGTQHEPNAGFTPVPAGWYNVAIEKSEMKSTAKGDGAMMVFTLNIIDGQYAGKKLFVRLNIQNPNQQAVDIAYGELSAISHAVGVIQWNETTQLHGIPFQVQAAVGKTDKGTETNEVKAYKDAAGNEPGKAPAQQGGAPAAFGGQPAQQQQPAFGGQAQPGPAQGQPAFGGAPAGQQPAQGGQPAFQPQQGQAPAQQPAQQPPAQGGAPWGGGQPTQPAQQSNAGQQPAQQWQQPQGGAPAGGAPWGQPGQ